MVKFPGAYKATDPYANFSIYNGKKDFPMPGPKVWAGGASSSGGATTPAKEVATSAAPAAPAKTTMATVVAPAPAAPTKAAGGAGCAALYGQCGGKGFSGAKCCSAGTCKAANDWYSQCVN
jgi:hypothetical protein